MALTAPLYEVAERYFGMQGKDRALLQSVGDAFRAVDKEWLTRYVMAQGDAIVCADVRLPREGELLRAAGWIGLRVERDESARRAAILAAGESVEGAEAQHATETMVAQVPVDGILGNYGTIADLETRAVAMVREILRKRQV